MLRRHDAVILARRCLLLSLLHDRVDQERDIEARNTYCDTVDKVGCLAVGESWLGPQAERRSADSAPARQIAGVASYSLSSPVRKPR